MTSRVSENLSQRLSCKKISQDVITEERGDEKAVKILSLIIFDTFDL